MKGYIFTMVPTSVGYTFGGKLFSSWSDCKSGEANFDAIFDPWFRSCVKAEQNSVHIMSSLKDPLLPGINLFGVDSADFPITTGEYRLKATTKGKSKDWEKAKKDGKIVLKPMFAYTINGAATPNIYPSSAPTLLANRGIPVERYTGIGPNSGICRRTYNSVPALEGEVFMRQGSADFLRFQDPNVTAVSKLTVESIQADILQFLSKEEPNGTLVTKVVSEANSATFDIATEIGEMPETIKMLMSGIKEGIKLLLRAKREIKQNLSSGSVVKDAASLWMGYRYGLMPIVYSINDGLDLLEMENKKFQSFRGRVDTPAEMFNARGYTCVKAPVVEHRCFLKYGYDLESSVHQGLKINLAATAWELIPLSFVFDWFFQVGDYLTAFFTPGVVNQIGCMYSYRVKGEYVFQNDTNSIITFDVDYYRSEIIKPNSYIGINSEVFVSFKRTMDAISLSWLLFKKDKPRG